MSTDTNPSDSTSSTTHDSDATLRRPTALQKLGFGVLAGVLAGGVFFAAYQFGSRGSDRAQPAVAASNASSQSTAQNGPGSPGRPLPPGHPPAAAVSDEQAGRIAELRTAIQSDPADPSIRHTLMRYLLESEQYMAAYNEAAELTREWPEDVEAQYVRAVVHMRMGQTTRALTELSQVLESSPDHVDALLAYGLGQLRIGDASGAIASWERGLIAAGGRHAELERFLAVSRSARAEKQGRQPERPAAAAPQQTSGGLAAWVKAPPVSTGAGSGG